MKKLKINDIIFVNLVKLSGNKGDYEMLSIKFFGNVIEDGKVSSEKTLSTLLFPSDLKKFMNACLKSELELNSKTVFKLNKFKTKDGIEKEELQINYLFDNSSKSKTVFGEDDKILWD